MTLKAPEKQQSNVTFFRIERKVAGRSTPELRRVSRHGRHSLAEAIVVSWHVAVNANLAEVRDDFEGVTIDANSPETDFLAGTVAPALPCDVAIRLAALDDDEEDEDEDEDYDDDELDEEADEDLEDEDDEDFDDDEDLEDEDDLDDDDDLDDEDEDEE